MEWGTLYQLRNLIDRRNVSTTVKSDVNAAEDFLETIVTGYIITAVMAHLNMTSLEDAPDPSIVSSRVWTDDTVRAQTLQSVCTHVVTEYVDLEAVFEKVSVSASKSSAKKKVPKKKLHKKKVPQKKVPKSTVYEYTCAVISLGLLYLDFKDAVREGDGERVLRLYKYLMLIWKATGHKNYAIEAFTLLSQYHLLLPQNLAEQLKWSRFVNVHGLPGHNISCDLHMEHLNRLIKTAIEGLGANKSKKAITRAGKAVGSLRSVLDSFDREIDVPTPSGKHSEESRQKDLNKICEQLLLQNYIFDKKTKKCHKSFASIKKNVIKKMNEKEIKQWMVDKLLTAL